MSLRHFLFLPTRPSSQLRGSFGELPQDAVTPNLVLLGHVCISRRMIESRQIVERTLGAVLVPVSSTGVVSTFHVMESSFLHPIQNGSAGSIGMFTEERSSRSGTFLLRGVSSQRLI